MQVGRSAARWRDGEDVVDSRSLRLDDIGSVGKCPLSATAQPFIVSQIVVFAVPSRFVLHRNPPPCPVAHFGVLECQVLSGRASIIF